MPNEVKIQVSLVGAQAAAQQIAGLKSALDGGTGLAGGGKPEEAAAETARGSRETAEATSKAAFSGERLAYSFRMAAGEAAAVRAVMASVNQQDVAGGGAFNARDTAEFADAQTRVALGTKSATAAMRELGAASGEAGVRMQHIGMAAGSGLAGDIGAASMAANGLAMNLVKGGTGMAQMKALAAGGAIGAVITLAKEGIDMLSQYVSSHLDQWRGWTPTELTDRTKDWVAEQERQKGLDQKLDQRRKDVAGIEDLQTSEGRTWKHIRDEGIGKDEAYELIKRAREQDRYDAERKDVAGDLAGRAAKAFVESQVTGDTAEYDRLRGLQKRFESGELSRTYSMSSPKEALALAEAAGDAAKAKDAEDTKALELYRERNREMERELAVAQAIGDKTEMAAAQARKGAIDSGLAEKLGGGDVDKGLATFDQLYSKAAGAAQKRAQEDSQYTTAPALEYGSAKAAQMIAQIMAGGANPQVEEARTTNELLRRMLELMGQDNSLTQAIPVFGG